MWFKTFVLLLAASISLTVSLQAYFATFLHAHDPLANTFTGYLHTAAAVASWTGIGLLLSIVVSAQSPSLQWSLKATASITSLFLLSVVASTAANYRIQTPHLSTIENIILLIVGIVLPMLFVVFASLIYFVPSLPLKSTALIPTLAVAIGLLVTWQHVAMIILPGVFKASFTIHDVFYPSVLIHDGRTLQIIVRPEELESMPSNLYMNRTNDPILIDSRFIVFELSKLKMRGSELGLVLTGPKQVDVSFDLKIVHPEHSIDISKKMIVGALRKYDDSPKATEIYERMEKQDSLRAIIQAVREVKNE